MLPKQIFMLGAHYLFLAKKKKKTHTRSVLLTAVIKGIKMIGGAEGLKAEISSVFLLLKGQPII